MANKEFDIVDAATRQILKVVLLKVDLDASTNPIICKDCTKLAKKSYFFKSVCMDTEKLILSYYSTTQERSKFDMKDVYEDSKGVQIIVEDFSICCYCMQQTLRHNCVSIDVLMSDVMYKEMMAVVMPEKVLDNIKDPVICTSCRENLESYIKFARTCLDIEGKIKKYHQNTECCSTSQIILSEVASLFYNENCAQIMDIKQEHLLQGIEQKADYEIDDKNIKCETVDIKDENCSLHEIAFESLSEVKTDKYETYVPKKNDEKNLEIHKAYPLYHVTADIDNIQGHHVLEVNNCNDASKIEIYKCEKCIYATKLKMNLKKHMLVHKDTSEVKMYKCDICTYETKYKNSMKNHALIHKDNCPMHKCEKCNYETKHKMYLKKHMLVHRNSSEIKMYKCEICAYETKNKKTLETHILVHKAASEVEMYKCEMCTYETTNKKCLNRHALVHKQASEVKMYKCEICTYETRYKNSIKNHTLLHKDACTMYKCETCSYATKLKMNLKKHMLVHKATSEVRMYKCEICTYETKRQKSLEIHILTHKDTCEMYKCEICSHKTKYKFTLKRHMVIHKDVTDIEMYKCEIDMCSYETKHKDNLKRHMLKHKNVPDGEMHKCGKCAYKTKYKRCLKKHLLIHN